MGLFAVLLILVIVVTATDIAFSVFGRYRDWVNRDSDGLQVTLPTRHQRKTAKQELGEAIAGVLALAVLLAVILLASELAVG